MSGRGVLFAIDDEELAKLGDAKTDDEVRAIVAGIEERWENACELDKAWDAIHRALTDGKLALDNGREPLRFGVLGGAVLVEGEDVIVSVKAADEVHALAAALAAWDRGRFRAAYYKIDRSEYGDLDEDDLEYCFAYFQSLVAFYREAAAEERAVVFAADL